MCDTCQEVPSRKLSRAGVMRIRKVETSTVNLENFTVVLKKTQRIISIAVWMEAKALGAISFAIKCQQIMSFKGEATGFPVENILIQKD